MCREPSPNGCRSTEAFCRRAVTSCYCSFVIRVGDGFDRSMVEIVVAQSHKTSDRDACSAACMSAEYCSNLNAGLGLVWPSPTCETRCKDLQATGRQASSFPELRHPAERHRRSFRIITLKLKLLACCWSKLLLLTMQRRYEAYRPLAADKPKKKPDTTLSLPQDGASH